MKSTVGLISVVLLVIAAQNTGAREPYPHHIISEQELCKNYALAKQQHDLRGIRDIWKKIKDSALKTWNYIKGVAEKAKKNVQAWIENAKEYANKIKEEFKEKLEDLKNKVQEIISDVQETGELVKICFKKEKENINSNLKIILKKMGDCIAEEILKLPDGNSIPKIAFNETDFTKELEEKAILCERDIDNFEDCLCKAREDIFDNLKMMEDNILKTNAETRDLIDDIKSTIVTCSISNLIEATNFIAEETIEIINCVKEIKNNGEEENNNESA